MKEKWLLLHGALGSKQQMEPLKQLLGESFMVYSMSLTGHGERSSIKSKFSISLFSEDVKCFLNKNEISKINIFGHSMGGYVALYFAYLNPSMVNRIITLGTKFYWSESFVQQELALINPFLIEEKVPHFANTLKKRHSGSDWKEVLRKSSEVIADLGRLPLLNERILSRISQQTTILLADNDSLVSKSESVNVSNQLTNSKFHIIADSEHQIEKVNLNHLIKYF